MVSPYLHPLWINITFYKTEAALQSYLSTFTVGPVLEPSPSEGEEKPMTRNLHPVWGPWYVDTLLIPSRIPSKPSFSTALPSARWYRAATWCLTLKSWLKVVLSPREREWVNIQLLASVQLSDFWQQSDFVFAHSRQILSCSCVQVYLWTFCCVLLRQKDSVQTTSMEHRGWWWSIQSVPPKEWRWEANYPRRTLFPWRKLFTIPGVLRCLGKREVAPDTPNEI